MVEDLRDTVVRESGDFFDVSERTVSDSSECAVDIADHYLRSLVKTDLLAVVDRDVLKVIVEGGEDVEELCKGRGGGRKRGVNE